MMLVRGLFLRGFNTQPPEGGWSAIWLVRITISSFNTQPPEGGWPNATPHKHSTAGFNTERGKSSITNT